MPIVNTNIAETTNITQNGTYDVARYTTANVNVSGGGGICVEKTVQENTLLSGGSFIDLTDIYVLSTFALTYAYWGSETLEEVDFKDVETIEEYACGYMCEECTNLTTVIGNSIYEVQNSGLEGAFTSCSNLSTLSFPNLTTIREYGCLTMCFGASSLTSVVFDSLTTVEMAGLEGAFSDTGLTNLEFPVFNYSGETMFCFSYMLDGVTGCTVHFPSAMQSEMENWEDVIDGFGGTNTIVLFDL